MMNFNIVIPMAGTGNRFRINGYKDIKPMIKIGKKRMIELVIDSIGINGKFIFIVSSHNNQSNELIKLLNVITDKPEIIEIDYLTDGPASSVLLAKEFINSNDPLIVTNCDQILEWDSNDFLKKITETNKDGIVVTYNASTEKNSYVKLNDNGDAVLFAEKKVISEYSLNGIHFWKKGYDYVTSAESMIHKNIRVNNEFYIAPTYNEMILDNKKIGVYHIDKNKHWPVGTPDDFKKYLKHANL